MARTIRLQGASTNSDGAMARRMRSAMLRKAALTFCTIVVASACEAESSERRGVPAFALADSAGVTVAVTDGVSARVPSTWKVSMEPEVQVGAVEGDLPEAFASIRGMVSLQGGDIAVADGASRELRLFSHEGVFRFSVGRRGEGPGEFSAVQLVPSVGQDTLVAFDRVIGRLTVFEAAGGLVGSTPVVPGIPPRTSPEPLGSVGRQVLLVHRNLLGQSGEEPGRFYRVDAISGVVDTIVILPGRTTAPVRMTVREMEGEAWAAMPAPYDLRPTGTAGPRSFFVTAAQGPEVLEYDPQTGDLVRVLRLDEAARPVTRADEEAWKDWRCRASPDRASCLRWWENEGPDLPLPEVMPAFDRLLSDDLGWLWARVNEPLKEDDEPQHWLVFDPEGRGCGVVEIPGGIDPAHITAGRVLALWRDDFGVEHIRGHRLDRGGSAERCA